MKIYYDKRYMPRTTGFDTYIKAGKVADGLRDRPVDGVEIESPPTATVNDLLRAHDDDYVGAVRDGHPSHLAASNGIGWTERLFEAASLSTGGAIAAVLEAYTTGSTCTGMIAHSAVAAPATGQPTVGSGLSVATSSRISDDDQASKIM